MVSQKLQALPVQTCFFPSVGLRFDFSELIFVLSLEQTLGKTFFRCSYILSFKNVGCLLRTFSRSSNTLNSFSGVSKNFVKYLDHIAVSVFYQISHSKFDKLASKSLRDNV